jgi:hypothetical protein
MAIAKHKHIRAFKIPMQDPQLMEGLKPTSHLHKNAPKLFFAELGVVLGVLGDFRV